MSTDAKSVFMKLPADLQELIILNMDGKDCIKLCYMYVDNIPYKKRNLPFCNNEHPIWSKLFQRDFKLSSKATLRDYKVYKELEDINDKKAYILMGAYEKFLQKYSWFGMVESITNGLNTFHLLPEMDGMDINIKDINGNTYLTGIPHNGKTINDLVMSGADVNLTNAQGLTPLMTSMVVPPQFGGDFDLILSKTNQEYLNYRTDENIKFKQYRNKRAIDIARDMDNEGYVEKLLARGAEP
jgi:ankyrin repeat protein